MSRYMVREQPYSLRRQRLKKQLPEKKVLMKLLIKFMKYLKMLIGWKMSLNKLKIARRKLMLH